MTKINCVELLTKTNWVLSREGFLFRNKIDKLQMLKFVLQVIFCVFTLILIASSIASALKAKDISALNQLLCLFISAITVFAKEFTLLKNQRCYMSIISDAQSVTFNAHSNIENQHVSFVNRISTITLRYYVILAILFLSVTCFSPFVLNMRMMIPPPFDVGNYGYLYKAVHFVVLLYMSINSVTFDVLYISMLGLCVAQLAILQTMLRNAFIEVKVEDQNIRRGTTNCKQQHILRNCVILHEMINQFVTKLSTILSFPLFIQYTCGCFIICNAILQVTLMEETNTTDLLTLATYSSATFAQLVIYHWLGNEITFKSNKLIESCYLSKWYKLNLESQKLLIVLMERAKRPLIVELYALVYISLDSLGAIIRWSYSLFALIKATYKN